MNSVEIDFILDFQMNSLAITNRKRFLNIALCLKLQRLADSGKNRKLTAQNVRLRFCYCSNVLFKLKL